MLIKLNFSLVFITLIISLVIVYISQTRKLNKQKFFLINYINQKKPFVQMFTVKQQALNKIQSKQAQLPKNTQDSLQQMLAWDQEFLASKDKLFKNKHQYQGNGGSALLLNLNTNKKTNLQQQQQQQNQIQPTQMSQISQHELRQLQKKRKLQELARENSKILKSQKQQQKENNEQIDSSQDASDEYEVEKIVDKKIENGQIFYKVKWKGWDSTYNTWEPENNLFRVSEMIEEYEASKKYQKRQNFPKQVDSGSSDLEDNDKKQNSAPKKGETSNQINQSNLQNKNESLSKLQQSQQKIQSNVIKSRQPSNNTPITPKEQQDRLYKENLTANKQNNAKEMDTYEKNQNMSNSQIQLEKNKQFYQLLMNQKSQSASSTSALIPPQKQNQKNLEETQNLQNNIKNQEKKIANNIEQLDLEDDNLEVEKDYSQQIHQKSQNKEKSFEENEDGNEDDKEYIFEAILDKRQLEGQEVEYLLKFSNHDKPEWELISNLESIEEEIKEYEEGLKRAQEKAILLSQQENLDQQNLQFEEVQQDKEFISQTEPATSLTTMQSLVHQNKENQSQVNHQTKKNKIVPEQIDVDCSDDQFEQEVQKNQMDIQSNLSPQNSNQNINYQPDQQKKDKQTIGSELNSKQKQQQLNIQQVLPCQTKILENVIQNQQPFNLINPLLNNTSLQQLANISNPINYTQNYNFSQEIGCFYKGDQRFSIEPCDQSTLQDLSKTTFKVMWKPRVNGCVPLPSLISYQMLKEHDPVGLVLFFENLIQKQQQQIAK
ncbi:heterochromatin protein (macronuclear) [Tetrahymena thermophila SB210]|uniref:Heterochromatin protein n=1 Tax=Tetrahymena thermophila (strain SB210) TaxID=312017 RepID=Q229U0_TETTS|nr:heterochromatin protein [Tetrahymena thermophila SB210]EAR82061.4 heterochromatin protein [Tetrahymena thermophila SB210]|eukprot:XP_001029724.4 heterochromatin protein [Tetrahymena thermophila SB210]